VTQEQALAEARQRWGVMSQVVKRGDFWKGKDKCFVRSARWSRQGSGPTWEAAFADADRRQKEQPSD